MPKTHVEDGFTLGSWVNTRRGERARLPAERIEMLEAIPGWSWNVLEEKFSQGLTALQVFAAREGHARVPQQFVEAEFPLGRWVSKRRSRRANLPPEQVAALEAVPGWSWDSLTSVFEQGLAALHVFAAREGHARVPQLHQEGNVKLGRWVNKNRANRTNLTPEWTASLEAVPGWTWSVRDDDLTEKLAALRNYAAREGHTRVPQKHVEDGIKLGMWVKTRRTRRDQIAAAEKAALEAIPGWVWVAHPTRIRK